MSSNEPPRKRARVDDPSPGSLIEQLNNAISTQQETIVKLMKMISKLHDEIRALKMDVTKMKMDLRIR